MILALVLRLRPALLPNNQTFDESVVASKEQLAEHTKSQDDIGYFQRK